jgi:hypothetical protein
MAKVIKIDGSEEEVEFEGDLRKDLKKKQEIVGGYIELVPLKKTRRIMVVNKEGILKDLEVNQKATDLVQEESPDFLIYGSGIRGDVIICEEGEIQ